VYLKVLSDFAGEDGITSIVFGRNRTWFHAKDVVSKNSRKPAILENGNIGSSLNGCHGGVFFFKMRN
jgi:hypothetical protein